METMSIFGNVTVLVLIVAYAYATGLGSATDHGRQTAIVAALTLLMTGLCVLRTRSNDLVKLSVFPASLRDTAVRCKA